VEAGSTKLAEFGPPGWLDEIGLADLDLDSLVRAHVYGGGPGAFSQPHEQAVTAWAAHRKWHLEWRRSVADAEAMLAEAVRSHTGPGPGEGGTHRP
jgi:argininosuccinate lyase